MGGPEGEFPRGPPGLRAESATSNALPETGTLLAPEEGGDVRNDGQRVTAADEGELAAFLRSRRERLKPEQVGLPASGRRRTPGLRRGELATLAGVSVEYLERLEQGRDTNPSVAVLASLAQALRLSEDERQHLAVLAMRRHSAALGPYAPAISDEPRASVRELLDHLDPVPACLLGPTCDIVAWNEAWAAVAGPLGMVDAHRPNVVRYHFLNPAARRAFPDGDWEATADDLIGWLRSAQQTWGSEADFLDLVDELRAAPEFLRRWESHPVAYRRPSEKRVTHPDAGTLDITCETLLVGEAGQWITLWLPYDEKTRSAMESLLPTPSPWARGRHAAPEALPERAPAGR